MIERFCVACGYDLSGIQSYHSFGAWGECIHCLPCGKQCDKAGYRDHHEHLFKKA